MAYTAIIQISKNEISGQTEIKLAPSNEILRMALLKCVKGNILQKGLHPSREIIDREKCTC